MAIVPMMEELSSSGLCGWKMILLLLYLYHPKNDRKRNKKNTTDRKIRLLRL